MEQKGSHISFLVEKIEDLDLQNRIKKAFIEYLNDIKKEKECPACYKEKPDVVFSECSAEQLRRCISRMYDYDYCSQDYNRQLKKTGENEYGSVEIYYLNKKNDKSDIAKTMKLLFVLFIIWCSSLLVQKIFIYSGLNINPIYFDYFAYIGICYTYLSFP